MTQGQFPVGLWARCLDWELESQTDRDRPGVLDDVPNLAVTRLRMIAPAAPTDALGEPMEAILDTGQTLVALLDGSPARGSWLVADGFQGSFRESFWW